MTIELDILVALQESAFIKSTDPVYGETDVDTDKVFTVIFNVTPATSSLDANNFRLEKTDDGERFLFNSISFTNDWTPLSKTLTLHLDSALDVLEQYTFIIENLYDAAGNPQDQPYIITFTSSDISSTIPEEADELNYFNADDYSLVNNDIVVSEVTVPTNTADVTFISSTPTNLSYNITGTKISNSIDMLFSLFPAVDETEDEYIDYFTFERKLISLSETSWEDFSDEWHVYADETGFHICVIDDAELQDLDLGDGYEYRIIVSSTLPFLDLTVPETPEEVFLDSDYTLQFISNLPDMFTSVNSVLLYFGTFEPYDVAKYIYLNSQYVTLINENAISTWPAAINYVKFSTLYTLGSLSYTSASRIVLGDLEVESPDGDMLAIWKSAMDSAEISLGRKTARVWAVKGANHTDTNWSQTTRNWD